MTTTSPQLDASLSKARSRISNGQAVVPGADGRGAWPRRLRDLVSLHLADLGGEDQASQAERSIIRRCATLTVELERLESTFAANGEATPLQLDLYQRTANSLRRLLEAVGLERRSRDITPSVADYIEHIDKADAE